MNILFVTTRNPFGTRSFGGAESSSRLLAEKLAGLGHRIVYLTKRSERRDRLVARRVDIELRSPPDLPIKRLLRIKWPTAGALRLFCSFICRTRNIDLIYCFYEPEILDIVLAVRNRLDQPKIVMRIAGQQWFARCAESPATAMRYKNFFSSVDCANFISEDLAAITRGQLDELDMGYPFGDHFILDIGTPAMRQSDTAYAAMQETPFRIVMATRFSVEAKRQDVLIRAIAQLPADRDVEVMLIGDGPTKPAMQRLTAELGTQARINFLPFRDQQALWAQLEQANLLCHSVENEGLSKIVIESMALGLPVLTSDVASLNSYIRDCENGFLVANDPSAWATRIAALIDDPAARQRVSIAAEAFVRRRYNPDENVKTYEQHFMRLLSGDGPQPDDERARAVS